MKVFMLGWEFPPLVSGGLGVACYGLVKSLNAMKVDVLFVLPKPMNHAGNGHNHLADSARAVRQITSPTQQELEAVLEHAQGQSRPVELPPPPLVRAPAETQGVLPGLQHNPSLEKFQRVTFVPVDSPLRPYLTPQQYHRMIVEEVIRDNGGKGGWIQAAPPPTGSIPNSQFPTPTPALPPPRRYLETVAIPRHASHGSAYAADLFDETARYARLALGVAKTETFDVIHAHDWMTFEAAMAVAAATSKPLVIQVHSTEHDRAGTNANPEIVEVERQGLHAATRVIAVSNKTRQHLVDDYGVDPAKIEVVYNAADPAAISRPSSARPRPLPQKSVLFLGRLTKQKGPDLFLHAAKKVLSVEPAANFIIAGQGDLLASLKKLAAELGIASHVTFTGFVNKTQREKVLAQASVYVMPSISEPFGIASLDALQHDVPVIISKQSGVAEVLRHVLKVDFWDTDDLANKILAILRHPSLGDTLRKESHDEVRQLSWEASAAKILTLYRQLTRRTRAAAR